MYDYDIAVIGGGPAGYVAASYAAQFGRKVVLIEKSELGGCCLNTGCIPVKVLFEASRRYRQTKTDTNFGISTTGIDFSWEKLKKHSEDVRGTLVNGVESILTSRKIEIVYAEAYFKDAHTIMTGDKTLSADRIILATGTRSAIPAVYSNKENVVTSDEFWRISSNPKSMVIVGGGVIGCEMSSALSGLGIRVTLVEQLPRLLCGFSDRSANLLTSQLERDGVRIICGSSVTDIKESGEGLVVAVGEDEIGCNYVLWSTGRKLVKPNNDKIGIRYTDEGFVCVDENYRTNIENIYCIGDANGVSLLAYSASSQAMRVVKHICTGCDMPPEPVIPQCIYTYPELARIGMTEEDCLKKGICFAVGDASYKTLGYAHAIGDTIGYIRLIRDIVSDTIAGAEIAGQDAVELIHVLQPFVARKLQAGMFEDIIPAHPTLSEGIKLALEASYIRSPQM